MEATRVLITAHTLRWAYTAAQAMTGFATSIIACGCEAGIERELSPNETPDGRVGVAVLLFARSVDKLSKQLKNRLGQCVLTCPTTACFSGLISDKNISLGGSIRYFGDGWQIAKFINGKRYWRIPVMEGEFLCEETTGIVSAVGGGNFFILADTMNNALNAAEIAIMAMRQLPNIIMPFPGGIVRAGSKVGSKYPNLIASTNHRFCPTLRGLVSTELDHNTGSVMEIVIDGLTESDVRTAMRVGIQAICAVGSQQRIQRISAGNYGGKLGSYHFHLHDILDDVA